MKKKKFLLLTLIFVLLFSTNVWGASYYSFHCRFQHFYRWRCIYTGCLSRSMSEYSGYKFKFNTALI